ncbi:MAG: hypothetical protein FJ298_00755 [Planctomycetes bacterium]|nr:hypothetical protein [Planctomycetota bacterium]
MGVEDSSSVDLVARNEDGSALLVMVEHRRWDGSDERLRQLQDKVNAYLAFALDGQLEREFPGSMAQGITLLLRCIEPPDAMVRGLVPPLRHALAPLGVRFDVQVEGEPTLWRDPDESAG